MEISSDILKFMIESWFGYLHRAEASGWRSFLVSVSADFFSIFSSASTERMQKVAARAVKYIAWNTF